MAPDQWLSQWDVCEEGPLARKAGNADREAESKEKHGVWDPMPELSITSPYVDSRFDSNPFTMGNPPPPYERVDFIPQSRT